MHSRELADWWTRAGAFVLDQLIVAGAVFAIAYAIDGEGPRQVEMRGSLTFYAIVLVVGGLYAPLLMARRGARNGQTLGKQLVGIRVVRVDGRPLGIWTGVLRTVIGQQLLIGVTVYLYAIVNYLWPLRDARNQALHDKLARTWVMQAAAAVPPPEPEPEPEPPPGDAPAQVWLPPRAPGA